jgi:hypothetical protein
MNLPFQGTVRTRGFGGKSKPAQQPDEQTIDITAQYQNFLADKAVTRYTSWMAQQVPRLPPDHPDFDSEVGRLVLASPLADCCCRYKTGPI